MNSNEVAAIIGVVGAFLVMGMGTCITAGLGFVAWVMRRLVNQLDNLERRVNDIEGILNRPSVRVVQEEDRRTHSSQSP